MARAMNCSIFVTNGPNVAGPRRGRRGLHLVLDRQPDRRRPDPARARSRASGGSPSSAPSGSSDADRPTSAHRSIPAAARAGAGGLSRPSGCSSSTRSRRASRPATRWPSGPRSTSSAPGRSTPASTSSSSAAPSPTSRRRSTRARDVGAAAVRGRRPPAERPPRVVAALRGAPGGAAGEALGHHRDRDGRGDPSRPPTPGVKGARVRLLELRLADDLGGKGYLLFDGAVADVRGGRRDRDRADRRLARPRLAGHRPAPRRDGGEPGRRRPVLGACSRARRPGVAAAPSEADEVAMQLGTRHRHGRRHGQDARPRRASSSSSSSRSTASCVPVGSQVVAADAVHMAGPGELVYFVAAREAAQAMPDRSSRSTTRSSGSWTPFGHWRVTIPWWHRRPRPPRPRRRRPRRRRP